jgi:transcriptional regulator with XRE-family HTH domain
MHSGRRIRTAAPNSLLAREREARNWTEDDVATGLHQVAEKLGQPEPGVDANAVSRWERGVIRPSRRYALLLCLLFRLPPDRLGLVPTPWLLGEYTRLSGSHEVGEPRQSAVRRAKSASVDRAHHVARALREGHVPTLPYRPHQGFDRELGTFLASQSRVLLMEGSLGVGKTTLCCHVADAPPEGVVVQLHLAQHMEVASFDLSASILRYADLSVGSGDALQVLGLLVADFADTWVVIIDGVNDVVQWRSLGHELDRILSHIGSPRLRFLATLRSGPGFTITEYPILSALIHRPRSGSASRVPPFYHIEAWSSAEAQRMWDAGGGAEPRFSALPQVIQHLLRWPLYMRLAREMAVRSSTDLSNVPSTFDLVDTSERAALERVGADVEASLSAMRALATATYDREFTVRTEPAPRTADPHLAPVIGAGLAHYVSRGSRHHVAFIHDLFTEYSLALVAIQEVGEQIDPINGLRILSRIARSSQVAAMAEGTLELTILGLAAWHRDAWRHMMAALSRRVSAFACSDRSCGGRSCPS